MNKFKEGEISTESCNARPPPVCGFATTEHHNPRVYNWTVATIQFRRLEILRISENVQSRYLSSWHPICRRQETRIEDVSTDLLKASEAHDESFLLMWKHGWNVGISLWSENEESVSRMVLHLFSKSLIVTVLWDNMGIILLDFGM